MPPKKAHSEYMREWRKYRAQHGSVPVETLGSAGYALAVRIRKARRRGVFNAAELAELDSPIPDPGDRVRLVTVRPSKRPKTKIECTLPGISQGCA